MLYKLFGFFIIHYLFIFIKLCLDSKREDGIKKRRKKKTSLQFVYKYKHIPSFETFYFIQKIKATKQSSLKQKQK